MYNVKLGPGSMWTQRYGAANRPHGGVKLGSRKGVIWLLKMSQNPGYPQWYISTPARRSDPPFHMQSTGSPTDTPMHLALKDLHATWRGDNPNWVHNCQNGKIVHTHFGLAP